MKAPTREIADENARKSSIAKQYLEQREYEARKAGLIFVPSQGRDMTQAEYDDWYYNAE